MSMRALNSRRWPMVGGVETISDRQTFLANFTASIGDELDSLCVYRSLQADFAVSIGSRCFPRISRQAGGGVTGKFRRDASQSGRRFVLHGSCLCAGPPWIVPKRSALPVLSCSGEVVAFREDVLLLRSDGISLES